MKRVILLISAGFLSVTIFSAVLSAAEGPKASAPINVEPTTGNAFLDYPIQVPPGRGGIQPMLSLKYNSAFRGGITGYGWNLELGSIQRSTKKGVPKYDSSASFVFMQNGGMEELVFDSSANLYRAKIEGAFQKTEKSGDMWIITDGKGTKYFFGQTNASRQYDPANPTRIFKWCLDKVEDVNGNYMTISYQSDSNQIYPQYIDYTGNSLTESPAFARVEISLEDREDIMSSYISRFLIKTVKRIKDIRVSVNSNLQARYKINYIDGPKTARSLISSVVQYGSDGISTLPATTFDYTNGVKGFSEASGWTIPTGALLVKYEGTRPADYGVRIVDVNSDGYSDFVKHYQDCAGAVTSTVYLNNRENGWTESGSWHLPTTLPGYMRQCSDIDRDFGIRFGDVNGDGWVDVLRHYRRDLYWGGQFYNEAYLNNQINGFSRAANWDMPYDTAFTFQRGDPVYDYAYSMGTLLVDLNADGYPDVARSLHDQLVEHNTYMNNAATGSTGWTSDTNWRTPDTSYTNMASGGGASFVDLNGDSLPDIFYLKDGTAKVFMNNGQGFQEDTSSPWLNTAGYGDLGNGTTQLADINGDGFSDLIIVNNTASRALINRGNRWVDDPGWIFSNGEFSQLYTQMLDANGDGMMDFFRSYLENGNTYLKIYLNQGTPPDLLIQVNNGYGGVTSIEHMNSQKAADSFFPFSFQIVKKVTVSDSLGQSYTTNYEYSGGRWDAATRELRGFDYVRITDPQGNFTETRYLQDDIFKNRIQEQLVFNSAGKLFTRTLNIWDFQQVCPNANFVFLSRADQFVYDGDATGRRTSQDFFYSETPQLGHATKIIQKGEVDLTTGNDMGTDKRTVETVYTKNIASGKWLHGLPKQIITRDNSDSIYKQTWFFYDGQTVDTAPVKGQLSKKEDWAGAEPGAINPIAQYFYDDYGNLIKTMDPLNRQTLIAYDTTYHMFPLTTTNALNQQILNEYYGVGSVPLDSGDGCHGLWGQNKSVKDANNQVAKNVYDVFGRFTTSVGPLDSLTYPSLRKEFTFTTNSLKVKTSQRIEHGQAKTMDAVSYYDGLGRLIQQKTKSGTPGQYIVSGQTTYNSRALPERKYLPYFTSLTPDQMDPMDAGKPSSLISYDAVGRLVQTTNADGTYANIIYDDWKTETIDENGYKQASYLDSYGRLIKKEEYLGADGRCAIYPAQAYSVYATTQYWYDSEGNLTKTQDAKNNITTIAYDKLSRKISMTDPDMGFWQYGYDLIGNLSWQIDAKGERIDFAYDDLNRVKDKSGTGMAVHYVYDDPMANFTKGRLTASQYGMDNFTQFGYDELGREKKSTKVIDGTPYNVERAYDAVNNLKQVQYPDQEKIYYKYNDAGQVEGISNQPFSSLNTDYTDFERKITQIADADGYGWGEEEDDLGLLYADAGLRISSPRVGEDRWGAPGKAEGILTLMKDLARLAADGFSEVFGVREAWAQTTPIDYTTFAEQDPGNKVTITSSCISYANVETNRANTYVWKSSPTQGDFNYEFDGIITSIDGFTNEAVIWGASNTANETWDDWNNGLLVAFKRGAINLEAWLISKSGGSSQKVNVILNTRYYFRVKRQGNVVTLQIYTNSARTSLVATLSLTVTTLTNYQYLYGFNTQDGAIIGWRASGDVCRLTMAGASDTQAPTAPVNPNFSNATQTGLTLNWTASTDNVGVTGYRIDVSTNSSFSSFVTGYNNKDVGNVLSSAATGLTASTTYYARVRAYDAAGNTSGNSSTATGQTLAASDTQAPTAPASPSFSNATQTGLTLTWSASTDNVGVAGYRIDVSTNSSFSSFVTGYNNKDVGNVLSSAVTGLTASTTYYSRVRAYDAAGNTSGNSASVSGQTSSSGGSSMNSFNFLTFSEADPTAKITVSNDSVSFSNIETRTTNSYVLTPHSVSGDFLFEFDTMFSSSDTSSGETAVWGITNTANATHNTWNNGAIFSFYRSSSIIRFELENKASGSTSNSSTVTLGQRYYIRIQRTGGTLEARIYSDAQRTAVVQTLTRTDFGTAGYSYLYAFCTKSGGTTTKKASGDVSHMAVQSTADIQPPSAPADPNFSNATQTGLTLNWTASTDNVGVTGYKIDVATDSGFTNLISGYSNKNVGNVLSASVTGLTASTTYYARVRACDEAGNTSSNSATATGQTLAALGPQVFVSKIEYNAAGQTTRIEYGNGVVTVHTYNPLNLRLTRTLSTGAQAQVLQDLNYQYDAVGNITAIQDNVNSATQTFKYDPLKRLTEAQGQQYGAKQYQYDQIGNIIQKDGATYSYGENAGPHAVTSLSNGSTFTYDDNGNMTSKNQSGILNEYIYGIENRLEKVKKNGSIIAEYSYDGDGGRTKKVTHGANAETIRFVGSLFEISEDRVTKFIYLGSQRIAAITNEQVSYYLADHLGGTNVVVDSQGVKKEMIEYEPFGTKSRHEKYGDGEVVAWHYFTGQRLDQESELYYFGARYYDPKLGRFVTADPTIQHPYDPQDLNRYAYARNNPVNLTDPTGYGFKKWFSKVFGDFGQILGLVATAMFPGTGFLAFVGASAYTDNWVPLQNMAQNAVSGFVLGGGFFGAACGVVSGAILDTPQGKRATRFVADEIYDDMLGFHPSTAYILASIDLNMTCTSVLERAYAEAVGDPVKVKNNLSNEELETLKKGESAADEVVFGPTLKTKGAFKKSDVKGLIKDGKLVGSFQQRTLDIPGLREVGAQHTSANVLNVSSIPKVSPWRYATWGTCHEATNLTLLNAGISSAISNLAPSWDMYVTTAVYGNYGGQLGNRIISGINGNDQEE